MGTNYYARVKDLPAHHPHNLVHIGKMVNKGADIGYVFIMYSGRHFKTLAQWDKYLKHDDVEIVDEYDSVIDKEHFLSDLFPSFWCHDQILAFGDLSRRPNEWLDTSRGYDHPALFTYMDFA